MSALAQPPRKTWTRAEIDALEAAGLLAGTRFELIDGEVFDKMGQNPPHFSAIMRLSAALVAIFGLNRVRTQGPVEPGERDKPHSLPLPDVVVTREGEPAYRGRHPRPADVLLIAEISDSTYYFDVKQKGRLYARSGFSEYLLVDLEDRELLVHREPRNGVYTQVHVLRPGDTFTPLSAPDSAIPVADLFAD